MGQAQAAAARATVAVAETPAAAQDWAEVVVQRVDVVATVVAEVTVATAVARSGAVEWALAMSSASAAPVHPHLVVTNGAMITPKRMGSLHLDVIQNNAQNARRVLSRMELVPARKAEDRVGVINAMNHVHNARKMVPAPRTVLLVRHA